MQTERERQAAAVMMTGLRGTDLDAAAEAMIGRGIRSFILFGRNIAGRDQVRSLCAEIRALAGPDALIAIDHEGGRVNRLRGLLTDWPSPMGWAATGDEDLVRRCSTVMAQELAALGINVNFAPVADLLGNYRNPVLGTRCFSDDPGDAARFVAAFVEGHRAAGLACTAKHFPGHGDTSVDSHVDLPQIVRSPQQLLSEDLVPFRAALRAGVPGLMISHVWYSALDPEPTPATLSAPVAALARRDLGYEGMIVTDSLEMGAIRTRMTTAEAVVGALTAGADMVMVSHGQDRQQEALGAIADAIAAGTLPARRVQDAGRRIERLRGEARYGSPMPHSGADLAQDLAERGVTLVQAQASLYPLQASSEPIGVLTFSAPRSSLVEDEVGLPPLAAAIARRCPSLVHVSTPSDAPPDAALSRLQDVHTVIVGSAHAVGRPAQGEAVNRLLDAGKHVAAVALADPFDLLAFPRVHIFLAAYSDVPASVETAAAILFGERQPRGRLPVELPGLYPRYHGL
jgi:beta-N-acetylhexosaminidase